MDNQVFIGREFISLTELENFVKINEIKQSQIVSVNNTSTYHGTNRFFKSCFIYFYTEGLKYDCFHSLSEEQQEIIKTKPVKLFRYSYSEDDKKELLRLMDYDETSKKETFIKTFLENGYYFIKNEVHEEPKKTLFVPTINTIDYDPDYLNLLQKINPLINIENISCSYHLTPNPNQ